MCNIEQLIEFVIEHEDKFHLINQQYYNLCKSMLGNENNFRRARAFGVLCRLNFPDNFSSYVDDKRTVLKGDIKFNDMVVEFKSKQDESDNADLTYFVDYVTFRNNDNRNMIDQKIKHKKRIPPVLFRHSIIKGRKSKIVILDTVRSDLDTKKRGMDIVDLDPIAIFTGSIIAKQPVDLSHLDDNYTIEAVRLTEAQPPIPPKKKKEKPTPLLDLLEENEKKANKDLTSADDSV